MSRAFRISFDYSTGRFIIEVQGFAGLYWRTARVYVPLGSNEAKSPRTFFTYMGARAYVKEVGLDQIYADYTLGRQRETLAELQGTYEVQWPRPTGNVTYQTKENAA